MKVAVSADGKDMNATVDPRFGRAAYFLLVDTDTLEFEPVENAQNLQAVQGAGIQAATLVVRNQAEAVLTGHCGPKAFQTLKAAGIPVVLGVGGAVKDAVLNYRRGKYSPAEAPDASGHWS